MKFTFGKITLGFIVAVAFSAIIVGSVRPVSTSVDAETPSRIVMLEPTRSQGSFFTTVIEDTKTGLTFLVVSSPQGISTVKLEGNY